MMQTLVKLTPKLSKISKFSNFCHFLRRYVQSLKFLKLAKDTTFKFLFSFSVPKITLKNTPETLKPLFPHQEKQKPIFGFFSEKYNSAEKVSARQTTFS